MNELPQDPMILLSFVNTALRDRFDSLDSFCSYHGADKEQLEKKLKTIDYTYDAKLNRFA